MLRRRSTAMKDSTVHLLLAGVNLLLMVGNLSIGHVAMALFSAFTAGWCLNHGIGAWILERERRSNE